MSKVLLFGEPMALFVADEIGDLREINKYTRTVAGAEVNVAIGLTRLGHSTDYLTRLGHDALGEYITQFLKDEGIGVNHIQFDEIYKTGIQLKNRVEEGDAYAPYFRHASAASQINEDALKSINFSDYDALHVTGIPPAVSPSFRELTFSILDEARKNGLLIVFDPNLRPALWENETVMRETVNKMIPYCDIFLPGINEAEILSQKEELEDMFSFFRNLGAKNIIMKLGPEGALIQKDDVLTIVDGFSVKEVIDTVGAGDGFAVGVVSSLLEKESIYEAARRGNAIGALQVMHWSDNEALPSRDILNDFINNHSNK